MVNYFREFRKFWEDKSDQYIATIKKQVHVPKAVWFGMPVLLSNVKLGDQMIREPKVFYVTDFDSETVTIRNVAYPGMDKNGNGDDLDGEINLDNDNFDDAQTFTISRKEFYKLLEPSSHQGADYATASQTIPWRTGQ